MVRLIAVAVCLGSVAHAGEAAAQPPISVASGPARSLAKACGRTGRVADCISLVRGRLAQVADAILAELQAPVAAATITPEAASRVVWDGTFAHPDAPSFYTLKSYVAPGGAGSAAACAGLPGALRTDPQLLLKLTCSAERELLAAGADRWPDEMRELAGLRASLAACLPPAAPAANPCAAP